ncbi:MAG TPA: NAD(P)H-hydrate dehydratase [Nitrospirota bacterium]|nr:NAD(P)H-hydrate dehydratase [Nitrospirota bacterium]
MYIATANEMNNIDRRTRDEYGIPTLLLMENAASGITRTVEQMLVSVKGKRITVICGRGNNGGDGLASARQLHNLGAKVSVYLLSDKADFKSEPAINLDIALKMGIEINEQGKYSMRTLSSRLRHSHLIIDAMIGTGLASAVKEEHRAVIELINTSKRPVAAVDIPTGINSDTGEIMGAAVMATTTVTFALPKRGHFLYPGSDYAGRLQIVDISIPAEAIEKEVIYLSLLTGHDMQGIVPSRLSDSHKGTNGHALVIAGSIGKGGAAAMTALSCLRTGAGLLTLAVPERVQPIVAGKLTEVMTHPLAETEAGTISSKEGDMLMELSRDKEVVAIGPGLTTNKETVSVVKRVIRETAIPMVIDADAINALADSPELLRDRKSATILTPHPGEMSRLTGKSTAEVQQDRIGTARDFAITYGVYLILKGAHTVIAEPSGAVYISPTGNPGMATGGTGDALTGIIAGLIAQGVEPADAAKLGVYLHGLAGDIAAQETGMVGMIAGDLIEHIPTAIKQLERKKWL